MSVIDTSDERLYKILEYALGEIIKNCCQNSSGSGFVSAQYYRQDGFVRIGISDNGIGIKESFRQSLSPHFIEGGSDRYFLEKALEPEVISKNHNRGPYNDPVNAGVRLSIVEEITSSTYGHFFLCSGRSWVYRDGQKQRQFGELRSCFYPGVACSPAFRRNESYIYQDLISEAKVKLGLIPDQIIENTDIFQ